LSQGYVMSDDSDAPIYEEGDTISVLMQQLMVGIPELAGGGAERQAWALLHQVRAALPPEGSGDPRTFVANLTDMSAGFVHMEGDESERYDRLLAADHLLVNALKPSFEGIEDDVLEMRFEELRDCLLNIERINGRNPSGETRLKAIYEGLVDLSQTLGYAAIAPPSK
jgi:hypothetical protein